MATALRYGGFTVITARDGTEALARAREQQPDLAVLDVMMPGLDGREVCRRMSADPQLAHVPVILQSAASESDIDWRACAAVAFLAKPFNMRALPELVRRHLVMGRESRPGAPHLSDDEIRAIAAWIHQTVRNPGSPRSPDATLMLYRELSTDDEARVEAVLFELFGGAGDPGQG
jgi:CheY-like chemotaxis protein